MAYKINVKNSQNEFVNTGFLFQNTYYVDDTITSGLPIASFCSVRSGHSSCPQISKAQATLFPAGKDVNYKASGVIYTTSPRDMYGRMDDFSDEYMLYPYGRRQYEAIGLLKKCVIEISDGTKERIFRTSDEVVGSNLAVTTKNKVTITNDVALKYGDKIELEDTTSNVKTIHYVNTVNGKTITFTPENDAASVNAVAKCQIDEPVYLNNSTGELNDGWYNSFDKLPFTTLRAATGELDQLVGYVESSISVRIDLTRDISPIEK